MSFYNYSDLASVKLATLAAGGVAIATPPDWAVQFFGVPLTVVLAALFGALGALTMIDEMPRGRALKVLGFGVGCGTFLSPVVGHLAHAHLGLPLGLDRGIAFAMGLAPWWIPLAVAWLRGRSGGAQ